MKKTIVLLLVGILILAGLSASAFGKKKEKAIDTLEILPTMQSKSQADNQVWVGTFQLVWNDLVNEIIHNPVEFEGNQASEITSLLNEQLFTTDNLSDNAYYKKWGETSRSLKTEIEKGIKTKFNEKSEILNNMDWTPGKGKYTLYAMLKKDFEYKEPFNKLDNQGFKGSSGEVLYFGLKKDAPKSVRNIIHVLFFNDNTDFALGIKTKDNDIVYLYRTNDNKTLDEYYNDMMKKYRISTSNPDFTSDDELKVPYINFKSEKSFDELCKKKIMGSSLMLDKAIETIEFKMDEKGVKLKSEAAIATMLTALPIEKEKRQFFFDDKFVIFLQEKEKPYFALKVTDAKKLQK